METHKKQKKNNRRRKVNKKKPETKPKQVTKAQNNKVAQKKPFVRPIPRRIKDGVLIPIKQHRFQPAQGLQDNLPIDVIPNLAAIIGAPVGIICIGYNRGFVPSAEATYAYTGLLNDLVATMNGQKSLVNARPQYLAKILAAYSPKSLPYKKWSEVSYAWQEIVLPEFEDVVIVRGYGTYFYVPDSAMVGGWRTQVAVGPPASESEANQALTSLFARLCGRKGSCLKYIQSGELLPDYKRDASGFACKQAISGEGNSPFVGVYSRVESEIPYKSSILATMCDSTVQTRIPKFILPGSMDSTFAFSLGLKAEFQQRWYNTRYPPIVKFIDVGEIYTYLVLWHEGLSRQMSNAWPEGPSIDNAFVTRRFPFTARQFMHAVIVTLLTMFGDSQAMVQFMIPNKSATNGFEPLRVGSNRYGKIKKLPMRFPNVLIENLRNLQMTIYNLKTKYENDKNMVMLIPCLGAFTSYTELNPACMAWEDSVTGWEEVSMFENAPVVTDPNIIDGTNAAGDVIDIVNSELISEIIDFWNYKVGQMELFSVPSSFFGGSSCVGGLLNMTRIVEHRTVADSDGQLGFGKRFRSYDNPRPTLKKQNSKDKIVINTKDRNNYLFPSGTGLFNLFTVAISSFRDLTESLKEAIPYLILPIQPIDAAYLPTDIMSRIITNETKRFDVNTTSVDIVDTLGGRTADVAISFAPGPAAAGTETMANIVNTLNKMSRGGYLGDALEGLIDDGVDTASDASATYVKTLLHEIDQWLGELEPAKE